jgi:hypothetical protein
MEMLGTYTDETIGNNCCLVSRDVMSYTLVSFGIQYGTRCAVKNAYVSLFALSAIYMVVVLIFQCRPTRMGASCDRMQRAV